MTQQTNQAWCKSHAEFHSPGEVTDCCLIEFVTGGTYSPTPMEKAFAANRGGDGGYHERDAFELGPGGNYGIRLAAGFAIEEGRS